MNYNNDNSRGRGLSNQTYNQGKKNEYFSLTLSPLPDNATVTMAYVPFQTDASVYDDVKALEEGTLFPVLNKPFLAAGGCRG